MMNRYCDIINNITLYCIKDEMKVMQHRSSALHKDYSELSTLTNNDITYSLFAIQYTITKHTC